MHFLKTFGRVISEGFLKLALGVFALTLALSGIIGSTEPVKTALDESSVYATAADSFIDSIKTEQGSPEDDEAEPEGALSLKQPEVREAVRAAFGVELLKPAGENFIDGIYGWLAGKTPEPEFTVDLRDARQTFIEHVTDAAEDRLRRLEPCSARQKQLLAGKDINPFTVECRPINNIDQQKKQLIAALEKETEFLEDAVFTPEDLKGDSQDKFTDELKGLPGFYQFLVKLPLISGILIVVSALALIWLYDQRRRGIHRAAVRITKTGARLLVFTLIAAFIISRIQNAVGMDDITLRSALTDTASQLIGSFNGVLMTVALIYTAIGGSALISLWYLDKKDKETKPRP